MIEQLYLTHRWNPYRYYQWTREYSTFFKVPELVHHHRMQFSVIPRTLFRGSHSSAKVQLVYFTAPAVSLCPHQKL